MRTYILIIVLALNSLLAPVLAVPFPDPAIHASIKIIGREDEHDRQVSPTSDIICTTSDFCCNTELYPRSPKVNKKALHKFIQVAKTTDNVANGVAHVAKYVPGPVGMVAKGIEIAHKVGHAIAHGVKRVVGFFKNLFHRKKKKPATTQPQVHKRDLGDVPETLEKCKEMEETDELLYARGDDFMLSLRDEVPIRMGRRLLKTRLARLH